MQTVFITITRGTLARNILRNDVFKKLTAREDIRVVLIIPQRVHDYFRKEFAHPRVIIEIIPDKVYSKWRKFFIILFNGLVYTETEHRMLKHGGANKQPASRFVYLLKHNTFSFLSKFSFPKQLARWIEQHIFIQKDYDHLLKKYTPSLIFCSSIYSKPDVILIKAGKRFGIPSVSMPKSWDTVGRLFFRAVSDRLVVNNDFMTDWIVEQQLIPRDHIDICGMPQFDVYGKKQSYMTKEAFCERTGLDATKPIVLYASEGMWTHWDDAYVEELITAHNILDKYNLILRPHFSDAHEKRYARFADNENVYVDDQNVRITNMFGDRWDPSEENMDWLAEVIHVSDVVVTFMTTFVLDSFAYDKPVINIYYDLPSPRETSMPVIPMHALYNCTHYNAVLAEEPTTLVRSGEEVMQAIDLYLRTPGHKRPERQRTIEKLAYKIDGKAGERIYAVVSEILDKKVYF